MVCDKCPECYVCPSCGLSMPRERRHVQDEHAPHCVAWRHVPKAEAVGIKHDTGKRRWSLLPWGAVASCVDVLMYGAGKYGDGNWKDVPDSRERYFDAALRHLTAWQAGQRTDAESGLPSLAHAGCCVLFLIAIDAYGNTKIANSDVAEAAVNKKECK